MQRVSLLSILAWFERLAKNACKLLRITILMFMICSSGINLVVNLFSSESEGLTAPYSQETTDLLAQQVRRVLQFSSKYLGFVILYLRVSFMFYPEMYTNTQQVVYVSTETFNQGAYPFSTCGPHFNLYTAVLTGKSAKFGGMIRKFPKQNFYQMSMGSFSFLRKLCLMFVYYELRLDGQMTGTVICGEFQYKFCKYLLYKFLRCLSSFFLFGRKTMQMFIRRKLFEKLSPCIENPPFCSEKKSLEHIFSKVCFTS